VAKQQQWTVLVWIAGDNNLDDAGVADIGEMKDVGSGDEFDIVVQFDRRGDIGTRRYHLQKGTTLEQDLVEDLGETNTGDPAVAIDFFTWGISEWPADKVLAVLWNHGSGIDETDIYAKSRAAVPVSDDDADVTRGQFRAVVASAYKRSLFSTTVEEALTTRSIAIDDQARDFLDNAELKRVLEAVAAAAKRPVDVLGFDACLMNMVEVAYQLKGLAGTIVGSEETEPGAGWPYREVLSTIADSPAIAPRDLAASIVQRYLDSYAGDVGVTQSALDLSQANGVAAAVDALASACIAAMDDYAEYFAFDKAAKSAQRFYYDDFADLGDFCAQLLERTSSEPVKTAARAVIDAAGADSPIIIAAGNKGPNVERATGLAIYLPRSGRVTVAYDKLDFAGATKWDDLLVRYLKT
jgi:hypothetical protein